MKLSIFTSFTNPIERNDPWEEALECYKAIADEVIVVGSDWPKEFKWDHIGKTFQEGFDKCSGDWVIRMDIDYFIHENDITRLKELLRKYNDYPAIAFPQYQFYTPTKYSVKTFICIALNKKNFPNIKLNGGGDLCLPTLNDELISPFKVPLSDIPIWQYDNTFKTKKMIELDRGRFARAWYRYFDSWNDRGGETDKEAYEAWLNNVKNKSVFHIFTKKISNHPKFIQKKLESINESHFGWNGFGILDSNKRKLIPLIQQLKIKVIILFKAKDKKIIKLFTYKLEIIIYRFKTYFEFILVFIYYKLNWQNLKIKKIILENRKTLSQVSNFLTKEDYAKNNYGIQQWIYEKIDKKIPRIPTYSDLLIYLIKYLYETVQNVNYLEIGASVLKNVIQLNKSLPILKITIYDINPINPNFSSFINQNSNITYFQGDVLSSKDAENFRTSIDKSFNLIFSDALHIPDAVEKEFKNLIEPTLDSDFIIYYDDYGFKGVEKVVNNIAVTLKKKYHNIYLYTFHIHGWIGRHEKTHKNAIITNLNLERVLKEEFKLYKLKSFNF